MLRAGTSFTVVIVFFLGLSQLISCAGPRALPTPNLYLAPDSQPFADVPPGLQSSKLEVLYFTDRQRTGDAAAPSQAAYGSARSWSLAFGSSVIEMGEGLSWQQVVNESQRRGRRTSLNPNLRSTTELARFPPTPLPLAIINGQVQTDPEIVQRKQQVVSRVQRALADRLAKTPRKEAFVLVHGFNYQFERAVSVMGELWHLFGRVGIPVVYTWPSGQGSYLRERESSLFTVHHFKNFLKLLAQTPELERIHLIAHSRGTDIVTSGLRELRLELGPERVESLKIHNLVLAAPDLDRDVAAQRLMAERVFSVAKRTTIYVSPEDVILKFAELLYQDTRVGRIKQSEVRPEILARLDLLPKVHVVNAEIAGSIIHGYFYDNPAVSSDLILLLRDDRDPGAENGRPLEPAGANFWKIPIDYPLSQPQ